MGSPQGPAKERSSMKPLYIGGAPKRGACPDYPAPQAPRSLRVRWAIRSEVCAAFIKGVGSIQGPPGARPPVNAGVGHSRPSGPCVGWYGLRRRVVAAMVRWLSMSLAWMGSAWFGSSLHEWCGSTPTLVTIELRGRSLARDSVKVGRRCRLDPRWVMAEVGGAPEKGPSVAVQSKRDFERAPGTLGSVLIRWE
jgi:hypothetical protein